MANDCGSARYSRQILLGDIAIEGQQKLLDNHVLIVGLDGLGSPTTPYLVGVGIGKLTPVDDDDVYPSGLQCQILSTTDDIACLKSQVAQQRLMRLDPDIGLVSLQQRLKGDALQYAVARANVVLDYTDNTAMRQEINAVYITFNIPLVTASTVGLGGQLMVLVPPWEQGCYRCLWPGDIEPEYNCRIASIIEPVVDVTDTLQALEAIKLLGGIETPSGKLRLFNGKAGQWRSFALRHANDCPVCGGQYADLV